jgi:hypothetical protein
MPARCRSAIVASASGSAASRARYPSACAGSAMPIIGSEKSRSATGATKLSVTVYSILRASNRSTNASACWRTTAWVTQLAGSELAGSEPAGSSARARSAMSLIRPRVAASPASL